VVQRPHLGDNRRRDHLRWFVGAAFVHTRRAGALLIVGLILNGIVPVRLPWI